MRQLLVDVLADADVLLEEVREILVAGVPVRLPVVDDADAHPAGMDFLTHLALRLLGLLLARGALFSGRGLRLRPGTGLCLRLRLGSFRLRGWLGLLLRRQSRRR